MLFGSLRMKDTVSAPRADCHAEAGGDVVCGSNNNNNNNNNNNGGPQGVLQRSNSLQTQACPSMIEPIGSRVAKSFLHGILSKGTPSSVTFIEGTDIPEVVQCNNAISFRRDESINNLSCGDLLFDDSSSSSLLDESNVSEKTKSCGSFQGSMDEQPSSLSYSLPIAYLKRSGDGPHALKDSLRSHMDARTKAPVMNLQQRQDSDCIHYSEELISKF